MAKEKKIPGIVKFLIFVAIVALLYLFVWPKAKVWLDSRSYRTANANAKTIYEETVAYFEQAGTNRAESISCEKIISFNGKKEEADKLTKYINITAGADIDNTYYSVLIGADKTVKRVFWSKTNKGDDIIGAYPDPISAENPEYLSLADCVKLEGS